MNTFRAPQSTRSLVGLIASLLLVCVCAFGCASRSNDDLATLPKASIDDQLYSYRSVLAELRQSPYAEDATADLERAQVWLNRVEGILTLPEDDRQDTALLLKALEGQLVRLRAYYARRAAENEVEKLRGNYEAQMKTIRDMRDANDSILQQSTGGN